jgi:hypothetical protein
MIQLASLALDQFDHPKITREALAKALRTTLPSREIRNTNDCQRSVRLDLVILEFGWYPPSQ